MQTYLNQLCIDVTSTFNVTSLTTLNCIRVLGNLNWGPFTRVFKDIYLRHAIEFAFLIYNVNKFVVLCITVSEPEIGSAQSSACIP